MSSSGNCYVMLDVLGTAKANVESFAAAVLTELSNQDTVDEWTIEVEDLEKNTVSNWENRRSLPECTIGPGDDELDESSNVHCERFSFFCDCDPMEERPPLVDNLTLISEQFPDHKIIISAVLYREEEKAAMFNAIQAGGVFDEECTYGGEDGSEDEFRRLAVTWTGFSIADED